MTTWYLNSGTIFDRSLFENLSAKCANFQLVQQNNFDQRFRSYLLGTENISMLTIVLDIGCVSSIRSILNFARRCGKSAKLAALRVITLSDFSTWGDKAYASVENFVTEFKNRSAFVHSQEQFSLENSLVELGLQYGTNVCIVGHGIFYGGAGMEMGDIFRFLWGEQSASGGESIFQLACEAETIVPITHIDNFVQDVAHLLLQDDVVPLYVASIDRPTPGSSPISLYRLLVELHEGLNGQASATSLLPAKGGTEGGSPSGSLWRCSLPVAAATADDSRAPHRSLRTHFPEVWAEFLAASALLPVTALVAGPPRCGKTEFSAKLAERLQVEHVTVESAVKFLLNLIVVEDEESVANLKSQNSLLVHTKAAVRAAAEAKANEGKKPAKGAVVPADGSQIDDSVLTGTFCQSLPVELQWKCLSAQALLHPRCRRRGFVLDAWDGKLVADLASLLDALNSVRGDVEGGDAPSVSVDLAIELHCRANLPVERLVASQGAQAKAKESQAAVKALEALLTAYAAQLVPITAAADEASDVRPEHMKTGHKGVAASCEQGTAVCRVDLNQSDPEPAAAWTEPLDQALGELLTLHGGRIGWLYTLADAAPSGRAPEPTAGPRLPAEEEAGPAGLLESSAGAEPNISAQIQQLDAVSMKSLTSKADKLQAFLSSTVLPQLAEGLVRIQREQPEDPVMFLAEQLARCSADRNQLAQDKARSRFIELLHQGGM